ncbi:MAG: hypothetical protein PWP10_3852 [Clostridiales bacterium]|jgi:PleD family two-component response regulator|nr:hypothetical protein [Clostridiales bacterium]
MFIFGLMRLLIITVVKITPRRFSARSREGSRNITHCCYCGGNIRSSDYFCRWGGEEFLLICHGLKQENALNFVTKLLTQVEGAAYPTAQSDKTIHITFSAGVAYPQTHDISADDALRRADRALFHAKANGRNRACHNTGDENEDIFTCMSSSC